jgi:hypothetical protein
MRTNARIWLWGLGTALTLALIVASTRAQGQEMPSGTRAQHCGFR